MENKISGKINIIAVIFYYIGLLFLICGIIGIIFTIIIGIITYGEYTSTIISGSIITLGLILFLSSYFMAGFVEIVEASEKYLAK